MNISGSVHGAPTGNAAPFEGLGLGIVGKKLEEYAYLCPGLFPWVNPGPATHESGMTAINRLTFSESSEINLSLFFVFIFNRNACDQTCRFTLRTDFLY